jgi:hypothetical protein
MDPSCSQTGANAVCKVCKDGGGDERMLLCEACDEGYHYDCLTPPLKGSIFLKIS